jgi:hypothetical protein
MKSLQCKKENEVIASNTTKVDKNLAWLEYNKGVTGVILNRQVKRITFSPPLGSKSPLGSSLNHQGFALSLSNIVEIIGNRRQVAGSRILEGVSI